MRKVRREIVKTINDFRAGFGRSKIYIDPKTSEAAYEYANYLLKERAWDNPDENVLEELCQHYKLIPKQKAIVGYSHLDDDTAGGDITKMAEFMDAHGLLLEMQTEMEQLSDPAATHIGVGFAEDSTKVLVVELLAESSLVVSTLQQHEDGSIHVEGLNLDPANAGLYAARIVSSTNEKKATVIGPANMTYDKATHQFTLSFEPQQDEVFYNAQDPRWLELYIRKAKIDQIPYGVASSEVPKVKELVPVVRLPMEYMPDPRVVKEDAHDQEQFERDAKERAERAEEERLIRLAQQAAKQEEKAKKREAMLAEREKKKDGDEDDDDEDDDDDSGSEKSGSKSRTSGPKSSQKKSQSGSLGQSASKVGKSMVGSDEDLSEDQVDGDDSDEDYDGGIGDLPSQPAMKRELITAIEDERREYQELKKLNEECQRKIILMDHNNRDFEKQTDQMLHEHKYLNTLANVHQVRYNLKETQDRYNRMAGELQNKLNEKQTKCTEIEQQFKELKRSVAMNAVHSRTGKKLSAKVIKEWEEADEAKDQEVHQYRLQNIALRNRLANQEKVLKKKEQLAEGLHLIDYEQLKIEN